MMYCYIVFLLFCSDNSYYIGITNNLKRRLVEHKTGIGDNSYTSTRLPVKLVFQQEFDNVIAAIIFEKRIKKWTRAKKEALIKVNMDMLQILSECRNASYFKYR